MTDAINAKKVLSEGGHYNPFLSVQNELSKIMRNFHGWFEPLNFTAEHFENLAITPILDIIDEKDNVKIKVEMPGLEKEDVKVSITDELLVVEGEKVLSEQDKDKNYRRREINWGHYKRNIVLPNSVNMENAKVLFKNGVLLIDIPKKAESVKQSRTLEVEG